MPELIAVAEQLLAPVPGGTGRYTRELLGALAATAPPDWTVTSLVSAGGDADRARIDGVRGPQVVRLPRRALAAAWERGVPLGVRGRSVHATTPLAPPRRAVGRDGQLVVTVHDAVPWTHPEALTPRGVVWHRRAITRAARDADALVVPTEAVAAELDRFVPLRAAVHVIGEGVASALLDAPDSEAVARELRLPPRYLLAVGTVEPRKGLDHLVRALSRPEAPPLPLLVVGQPGWGGVDPLALARERGLAADRVRLLGRVDDPALAVALRRAEALVAPSLAEGFGLPVAEAMALGAPVVHSDAPALVAVAGGAGLVTPRADSAALATALRELADDPALRARMRTAGLARAAEFNWENAARQVWRLHLGTTT